MNAVCSFPSFLSGQPGFWHKFCSETGTIQTFLGDDEAHCIKGKAVPLLCSGVKFLFVSGELLV